jgi:hypothetical protein
MRGHAGSAFELRLVGGCYYDHLTGGVMKMEGQKMATIVAEKFILEHLSGQMQAYSSRVPGRGGPLIA